MRSCGHFIVSVLDFPISGTASPTGCQASRSTVSWGGTFQTQFHHMRKNLASTGDPVKSVEHLVQCLPPATQKCWPPFITPARSSAGPLILSVAQLPCWPRPADQLPLAFFKACFNCKEQSLVTEQNIPCLFIDSSVREQRQLKESSFRVLRCSPIRGTKGEEIKGNCLPSSFWLQF